jgi:hypothetical protein
MSGRIKSTWEFFRVAWEIWGPTMSGTFSVPFAALSVFADQKYAQLIWGVMAYGALGFMSYLFYKRAQGLQERLIPKISAIYDSSKPPCRSISTFSDGTNTADGMVYRIEVENLCEEFINECEGYLTEIAFEDEPVELGVMNLTWADMPVGTIRIDLRPRVKRHLDILVIYENNQIRVCSLGWPINQQNFFSRHGTYRFTVVVGGRSTTLPPYKLRLYFTGDWQTSTMERI